VRLAAAAIEVEAAAGQVARTGTAGQQRAAAELLATVRRKLYGLLAEE
jgi:hypothetical protein